MKTLLMVTAFTVLSQLLSLNVQADGNGTGNNTFEMAIETYELNCVVFIKNVNLIPCRQLKTALIATPDNSELLLELANQIDTLN